MKVSNNPIGGRPALEELLSRKVGVLLHITEWVDKMDLSVREKSLLLRLTKNMYLSLAKNREFQPSVPIDKPGWPLITTRHNSVNQPPAKHD